MQAPHVREAAPAQHRATHLIEVPVGGISSAGAKYALQECEDRMRACTQGRRTHVILQSLWGMGRHIDWLDSNIPADMRSSRCVEPEIRWQANLPQAGSHVPLTGWAGKGMHRRPHQVRSHPLLQRRGM